MINRTENANEEKKSTSFVEQLVEDDLAAGKNGGRIQTRFPPEPNGYLHIGHAKAICMDFGVAEKYNGVCNLRFDDTNPSKENTEYVENILEDIKWLGFHWENVYYASDYFQKHLDDKERARLRGRADQRADSRAEGNAHHAGQAQSLPRPPRGGEPAPLRADEHARGRGRQHGAEGQAGHGQPEHALP